MSDLAGLEKPDPRIFLQELFKAGIAAARPELVIAANLPEKPAGRCLVIGAGKASAAMARAVELAWPDVPIEGIVSTRYGHGVRCDRIRIIEAGHPVPDKNSVVAADCMLDLLAGSSSGDLVLALVSGGGSACLAKPKAGISLSQKQEITQAILKCGASISEINWVRAQLSEVKGGQLAQAALPAQLLTLVISDVPGDDPSMVASGPTVPGSTSLSGALRIIEKYRLNVPDEVLQIMRAAGSKIEHQQSQSVAHCQVIASPMMALERIAACAREAGCDSQILSDRLEGEASLLAKCMAESCISNASVRHRRKPLVLISGGETTVTLPPDCNANGGRNTEFQLALALGLQGRSGIWSIAGDSDGIDGISNAAGAVVTPETLARAAAFGIDASVLLAQHRSYDFFSALGDLVITGPTLTNVNDLRIQLIG